MTEPEQFTFSHQEVVEALVKRLGIHEGIWGLQIRFGLGAANVGPDPENLSPAAIVPVVNIGIQKFPESNSLTVDAGKVNPRTSKKAIGKGRRRGK